MTNYYIKSNHKKAFTLAEVLITLLIIGVVASLVIPNLINDSKKAEYATKLQKEYSVFQQAFKLIVIDSGGSILNNPDFNCSGTTAYCNLTASKNVVNEFANKINIVKNCGTNTGCWYSSRLKTLGNSTVYDDLELAWSGLCSKATLADGTSIMIQMINSNCSSTPSAGTVVDSPIYQSVCGMMYMDVNGALGPNQLGRDYFVFRITKTGIYPAGIYNDGLDCLINSTSYTTSYGCAGKVLKEGAMNY
jgi:prepilin-type N-terminal cleavage/methylation domain-containing protein